MYHNCFCKVHLNPYTERFYREYHNPTIYIFYPLKVNRKELGWLMLAIGKLLTGRRGMFLKGDNGRQVVAWLRYFGSMNHIPKHLLFPTVV